MEQQIDSVIEEKTSAKLVRLENESLRQDVKRLLELLKKTKEFKDCGIDENERFIKGASRVAVDTK